MSGINVRFRSEIDTIGFVQVPNIVLRDSSLSDSALRTYMILLSYAWSKESCFPSIERMAKDRGVGVSTIKRTIRNLSKSGLISIDVRKGGRTNVYVIEDPHKVYAVYDGGSFISDSAIDRCNLSSLISKIRGHDKPRSDDPDDTKVDSSNHVLDKIVRGQESINNAKEKAKKSKDQRLKKKILKSMSGESVKKKRVKRKVSDTTTFEKYWLSIISENFDNMIVPSWGIKEKKIAKRLIGIYGIDLCKKVALDVIDNWDDYCARYKLKGFPSIGLISGYKDSFFAEVQMGKKFSGKMSKISDDEFSDNDETGMGW